MSESIFDRVDLARVEIYGRPAAIYSGSKLWVLPGGSILIVPPQGCPCPTPMEHMPNGDTRPHPSLVRL